MKDQCYIIHVIDEFSMGGAQTHLLTMLREAQRSYPDIKHLVVSMLGGGILEDHFRQLSIPVHKFDFKKEINSRSLYKITQELSEFFKVEKPSIVEAHLTWSRLLALPAAKIAGVPKRFGYEQGDVYFNSIKWKIFNFIGQFFAQKIIVCSQALKNWCIRTHKILPYKLAVFHNVIDPSIFNRRAKDVNKKLDWGFNSSDFIFCAIGSLGKGVNKRLDVSIHAIAKLKTEGFTVGLIICGDGDLRPSLEALVEQLSAQDRVKFLGVQKNIPDIMAGCDGFCHASIFEPFGIVIIEAMRSGLPVIVPRSGGPPEIVTDGYDGLTFNTPDFDDLAAKMKLLIKDKSLQEQFIHNGIKTVEEKFTINKYMKQLYRLYDV